MRTRVAKEEELLIYPNYGGGEGGGTFVLLLGINIKKKLVGLYNVRKS